VAQKNLPTCFCKNFAQSPPDLIIFARQMAEPIELSEVQSVSTSPNLCQHTTKENADAPNFTLCGDYQYQIAHLFIIIIILI